MILNENTNEEENLDEEIIDSPKERFRIITDNGQEPLRIDKFLMNRILNATRNKIQQAISESLVLVNGKPVKANHKVKPGEEIVVFETRKVDTTEIIPEEIVLDIHYEDADLMVINKPPYLVMHPASGNYSGTLANGIAYYLNQDMEEGNIDLERVGLVHRIDKNTSGLILVAKSELARQKLSEQFKAHTVHRRYQALAWGDFDADEGTIEAHVGRNQRYRKKMDTFPEGEYGKHAITHYKVLERMYYVTLLEFRLETGRTHQIRVHSKMIGHPLFNDHTYGGDRILKGTIYTKYKQFVENCFKIMPRQALHAKELGFIHPTTGQEMFFNSDLPEDFQKVLDKWRKYTRKDI